MAVIAKRHQARTYLPAIMLQAKEIRVTQKRAVTAKEIASAHRFADEKSVCQWAAQTAQRLAADTESDADLRGWADILLAGLRKSNPAEYFVVESVSGPSVKDTAKQALAEFDGELF